MPGLYIHIPFCRRKCRYCDFVSFDSHTDISPYIVALLKEMAIISPLVREKEFNTVFIGGGTPSILDGASLAVILNELHKRFTIRTDAEITIECNPESLTLDKLRTYMDCGVNRISIGLQSGDDTVLRAIGRVHTRSQFISAVNSARKVGFSNMNADIMHGLPVQTVQGYLNTIRLVHDLDIPHISSYALILEEHTPLYEDVNCGRVKLPDDDATADMEDMGFELLETLDYKRYEISNFARSGYECRHNLNYWDNGEYIGLGLNAHSVLRVDGRWTRWSNTAALDRYIMDSANNRPPIEAVNAISAEEEMFESIMVGLRKLDGISRIAFKSRFGVDPVQHYAAAVSECVLDGNMVLDDDRMRLTAHGLDFQNEVLIKFML